LLEDGGLRAERRERGLRQAKRFAWRSSAETLLATYEQVGRG
jgi:hypothetical protein